MGEAWDRGYPGPTYKIDEGSGDISLITQALLIAFDLQKVFQLPITLQNTQSIVAIHESLAIYFTTMTKYFQLSLCTVK